MAKAKITPLAIPEPTSQPSEDRASGRRRPRHGGRLRAPHGGRGRAREPRAKQRARFEASLTEKVDWFGCAASARSLRGRRCARRGRRAGGAARRGRRDPDRGRGARRSIRSIRSSSGSARWAAAWSATARRPIRGACSGWPSWDGGPCSACPPAGCSRRPRRSTSCCRASSRASAVDNRELADLGHGGLLSRESAYRFPPYRKNVARGELE